MGFHKPFSFLAFFFCGWWKKARAGVGFVSYDLNEQWKKKPGWLDYIGDEKLPSYISGLFHKPL